MSIWKLPEILVIHLKRFVEHPYYQAWSKLDSFIEYPLSDLSLDEFVESFQTNSYSLFAVSNHLGRTESGHYTAFCKRNEEWFYFDDETVTKVEKSEDVIVPQGYLLFYHRKKI